MTARRIIEIDLATGVVVRESYQVGDKLHRNPREGPAVITRSEETGFILTQEYYVNDQLHRKDGPAFLMSEFGPRRLEVYYRHGKHHRDPAQGPAFIYRDIET